MRSIKILFNFWPEGDWEREHQARISRHYVWYSLDTNTTYEQIIQMLIQRNFLLPLNDPSLNNPRLRYSLILEARRDRPNMFPEYTGSAALREGQTLASTHIIGNKTMDLICDISIEIKASSLPKDKPSSAPQSLGETIITSLTSREATAIVNFITIATGLTAFIGVLRLVMKQWSTKHATDSTSSQGRSSQPSETDIVAIHLRMTHGPDHEFEEWLTDPDRLKHYIDVFNQPSSSIQPLQAIFVQRNGKALKADVSKGTQNNFQLDVLLSYLNIDSAEK
jgi:hypothetical protein